MHFAISERLLDFLQARLVPDGCILFNAIVDDGASFFTNLKKLTDRFGFIRIIKNDGLAKREYFFVLTRAAGIERSEIVEAALEKCLRA